MIDLASETVVSLTEAAAKLPRRRAGKKPHVTTLYRWAAVGCRGVRLETLRVGGTLCTSTEAVQRFCEALTFGQRSPAVMTTRRRDAVLADEERRLQAAGV